MDASLSKLVKTALLATFRLLLAKVEEDPMTEANAGAE
jgi:hypothetical protein